MGSASYKQQLCTIFKQKNQVLAEKKMQNRD